MDGRITAWEMVFETLCQVHPGFIKSDKPAAHAAVDAIRELAAAAQPDPPAAVPEAPTHGLHELAGFEANVRAEVGVVRLRDEVIVAHCTSREEAELVAAALNGQPRMVMSLEEAMRVGNAMLEMGREKSDPAAVPATYALIGHGFTADPYFQLCADEKALLAAVTEMVGDEPADNGEDMAASITEELLATGSHSAEDGSLWLHRLTQPATADAEEDAYVIERMGKLLAEIAVVVNGPEPPLTRWSYHDLPAKVRQIKDRAESAMGPEVARVVYEQVNQGARRWYVNWIDNNLPNGTLLFAQRPAVESEAQGG